MYEKVADSDDFFNNAVDTLDFEIGYMLNNHKRDFDEWPELAEKLYARRAEVALSLVENDDEAGIMYGELELEMPFLRCNILAGTPEDTNTFFGGTDDLGNLITGEKDEIGPDFEKSAINWFLKTQGKTYTDILNAAGEKGFAASMKVELEECCGSYGAPAFLVTLDIPELEHLKQGGKIRIPTDAVCGIVDVWSGAGGCLGVELEKPVEIGKDMIYELQIEEAKNHHMNVDNIFGLTGTAWESVAKKVEEKSAENEANGKTAKKQQRQRP